MRKTSHLDPEPLAALPDAISHTVTAFKKAGVVEHNMFAGRDRADTSATAELDRSTPHATQLARLLHRALRIRYWTIGDVWNSLCSVKPDGSVGMVA